MDRRAFLAGAAGLLAAPLAAEAQPAGKVYRVGLLTDSVQAVENLREGLRELGYREGQSFLIEQRKTEGRFERLPAAVESLVKLPVDVIVAGGSESVRAARSATQTIPVVFTNVGDPIEQGFVASYAKPGGNITGVASGVAELTGKWLELLKEVRPSLTRVAVLWNPPQPVHQGLLRALESAAARLRLDAHRVSVRTSEELEAAFATIRGERVGGLTMLGSLLHFRSLRRIAAFAHETRLPAVAWTNTFPEAGGLMSYGVAEGHSYRRAATYVDKILKRRAAHQVRAGDQPQDRQGPQHHEPAVTPATGGSGDRVTEEHSGAERRADDACRASLMFAALAAAALPRVHADMPPMFGALHQWLGGWKGIGDLVTGMTRQGYDLSLTQYSRRRSCCRRIG